MGGEERERKRRRREKLHLLSRFDGDRTVGYRLSKRQSSSTLRGLHIKKKILDFHQAPGFSPTLVILGLRVI